jgi:hypothetical protein
MKDTILHFLHVSAHLTQNSRQKSFYLRSICPVDQVPQTLDWRNKNTKISNQSLKAGLHYQSFCDHSRNFAAQVNSTFWRICKKCLRKLIQCLTMSHLTNSAKLTYCDHINFGSVNKPLHFLNGSFWAEYLKPTALSFSPVFPLVNRMFSPGRRDITM